MTDITGATGEDSAKGSLKWNGCASIEDKIKALPESVRGVLFDNAECDETRGLLSHLLEGAPSKYQGMGACPFAHLENLYLIKRVSANATSTDMLKKVTNVPEKEPYFVYPGELLKSALGGASVAELKQLKGELNNLKATAQLAARIENSGAEKTNQSSFSPSIVTSTETAACVLDSSEPTRRKVSFLSFVVSTVLEL